VKRIHTAFLILVLILTSSCRSGGLNVAPGTSQAIAIEFARAAARIGLNVALQRSGVSAEDTAAILAELHVAVDAALAGKDINAILRDPAVWTPLRATLVEKFGAVIAKAKVGGIPIYDKASSEAFAGALVDSFASAVRQKGGI
jgi:hypothetical protein